MNFSTFRFNSIMMGVKKIQAESFLKTQNVAVLPVRNKNIKNDSAEKYRVLAHDRYTGKRTSCDAVPARFFRLHWGVWIRTIAGKDRKLYKKNLNDMRIGRQHVMCNGQQSRLLDKMAGSWYLRRHYYVDDPYEPYHSREEYLYTRRKPLPPK